MSRGADSDIGPVFDCFVGRLTRLAMRHHVPASECDDCVQDALLAWLTQHGDWSPSDPRLRRWLLAVVMNHTRLYHRRLRRRRTGTVDDLDSVGAYDRPPDPDWEGDPHGRDPGLLAIARDALRRLDDLNHQIILRRTERGLTYREIADELGLSAEQVRFRATSDAPEAPAGVREVDARRSIGSRGDVGPSRGPRSPSWPRSGRRPDFFVFPDFFPFSYNALFGNCLRSILSARRRAWTAGRFPTIEQ